MKVEINREEDKASITDIPIRHLALISIALTHASYFNLETARLSKRFKEIQEEVTKKDGSSRLIL